MISYLSIVSYDIFYGIVWVLLILYSIIYAISNRISVCKICVYRIILVCIEDGIINIWYVESLYDTDACYYAYQDK
jgi:hypothetical protein